MPPTKENPISGLGQTWAFPAPSGNFTIEVMSTDDMLVQYSVGEENGKDVVLKPAGVRMANSWQKEFTTSEDELVEVITDVDAQLIIVVEDIGSTMILGGENNFMSKNFISSNQVGNLTIINPNSNSATITWRNGGISVPENQSTTISWPPIDLENSSTISSNEDVMLVWSKDLNGTYNLAATDTGQISGMEFFPVNGTKTNTTSENNDYNLQLISNGDNGLLLLEDDGAKRCISIDKTASGWISTTLPWDTMNGLP